MNCYKTGDNKHLQCPPRMNDGRHFTDYRPNCYTQNLIRSKNGITNFDIGCPSKIDFEEGVQKYSYNWTEGGQYSRNSGQ